MADKKISELTAITGANTAADDFFIVVDTSGTTTKKISRAELNNAIERDVLSTINIDGGTIDNTVIGGTTAAAGTFTDLTVSGTVTGITTPTGNELENIVEDLTPQLGGTLDANGNDIDMGTNTITDTKVGQWDTAYSWGDHGTEGYLTANQTITLTGDVTGSGTTSISVTIADDSHNHVISNVDGLQTALDAKLALAGGTMTGALTVNGAVTATSFSGDGSSLTNLPETGDGGIAMAIALG